MFWFLHFAAFFRTKFGPKRKNVRFVRIILTTWLVNNNWNYFSGAGLVLFATVCNNVIVILSLDHIVLHNSNWIIVNGIMVRLRQTLSKTMPILNSINERLGIQLVSQKKKTKRITSMWSFPSNIRRSRADVNDRYKIESSTMV